MIKAYRVWSKLKSGITIYDSWISTEEISKVWAVHSRRCNGVLDAGVEVNIDRALNLPNNEWAALSAEEIITTLKRIWTFVDRLENSNVTQ